MNGNSETLRKLKTGKRLQMKVSNSFWPYLSRGSLHFTQPIRKHVQQSRLLNLSSMCLGQ